MVAFPFEPWPASTTVDWAYLGLRGFRLRCHANFVHFFGIRVYLLIITLNRVLLEPDSQKALDALIHEIVHLHGHHAHGPSFYRMQNRVRAILGLEPVWRSRRSPAMPKGKKPRRTELGTLWQEARP